MDDSNSLAHYGVLGMKWGVRKYTDASGNRVRKARIGSAERVRQKQGVFQRKIQKHDNNIIMRNTVNDWRRGRIAQLERKARSREAPRGDQKVKAYAERIGANMLAPHVLGGQHTFTRGAYNRYRQQGNDMTTAALKSSGKLLMGAAVTTGVSMAGRRVANELINQTMRNMGFPGL